MRRSFVCDKPLAEEGFKSYRCANDYGWVMIAARDDDEAMREAARSMLNPQRKHLQVWNGTNYEDVTK